MNSLLRLPARYCAAAVGVTIGLTAGTGVSAAAQNYPPTPPPIVINFPAISISFPPIIVAPNDPGRTIQAPQLSPGSPRPFIAPGMYPISSPTGAAPILTQPSQWQRYAWPIAVLFAVIAGLGYSRQRPQSAKV